ncbi:MAG: FHA domain-containing protein [Acidobacteriota bacterium]
MDITIRHLSGTHAGQEQTFPAGSITLGRNPSNKISFDPEMDRTVSGLHAELSPRADGWVIRDLGSSNGTFINEEKVNERNLRPGEIIQLGKNGPRLQLNFDLPAGVQPAAPPVVDAPPEGRTVMMMMNEGVPGNAPMGSPGGFAPAGGGYAGAPAFAAPPKKKGGILKALLIVLVLFGILIVAGIAGVAFLRGRNAAPEQSTSTDSVATATSTATTSGASDTSATATTATASAIPIVPAAATITDTAVTSTADTARTIQEAKDLQQKIDQQKAVLSQARESLQNAKASGSSGNSAAQMRDMERQLQSSQAMIDDLQRQLQQKNDLLQKTIIEKDQALQKAIRERNDALRRAREADARARSQSLLQPSELLQQRSPVQVAGLLPASALRTLAVMNFVDESPAGDSAPLVKTKQLKKRIFYVPEDAEIPLPDMPDDMPATLALLVIQSLGTTGHYVQSDDTGDAAISVVVTNFRSDIKSHLNTATVTAGASAIAGILGKSGAQSPVNARSVSMNADMAARVRLLDPDNNELGQFTSSASSHDRKTSTDLGGLTIREITNTDSALGDVTRKVAADAVESLLKDLDQIQWQGRVVNAEEKTVTLNCGSRCLIEVGDVFNVYDDENTNVATLRVKKVTPEESTASLVTSTGEVADLSGKIVKYAGRNGDSSGTQKSIKQRAVQLRMNTDAYDGPGKTFNSVKKLSSGTKLNLLYSVGTWARVSQGSDTFWIPLTSAQILD